MEQESILVVDDEQSIVELVRAYLSREGYTVHTASDGLSALEQARRVKPALVVLDLMLPGVDGLEVCRQLRQESEVYILMLTAKSEEADKVIGLSLGADDYLTKPFSPRELVARVKAILRRRRSPEVARGDSPWRATDERTQRVLRFRHLSIDLGKRQVLKGHQQLELTALEFDLLSAMAAHPGIVFTREQLLEKVWGYDFYGDSRLVDVHIAQLRKKMGDDPSNPHFIKTVRGVGYKFEDETA